MVVTKRDEIEPRKFTQTDQDREIELKAFDDSKAGVKGLVDAGVSKVPRIFINGQLDQKFDESTQCMSIPVIDLEGVNRDDALLRSEIINKVRSASEKWGFFQVVNHGIPVSILEEMIDGVRRFHEQDTEVKKQFYSRDPLRKVRFNSNFDLFQAPTTNWRDTLTIAMSAFPPNPEELPAVCRDITMEYSKQAKILGIMLFELLAEALGLKPDHLIAMDCAEEHVMLSHYYPACPEPELTMGTTKHCDPAFLTILLQDDIGGLQVLYQNEWVDVPPVPGAVVVNIGDLLQLMSNDKFKSVEHQVLANRVGPRVSVACFFTLHHYPSTNMYGPIKDLLSEDNPPLYKETSMQDFHTYHDKKGLDGKSALMHLKL